MRELMDRWLLAVDWRHPMRRVVPIGISLGVGVGVFLVLMLFTHHN